jgi:hypothetical protein
MGAAPHRRPADSVKRVKPDQNFFRTNLRSIRRCHILGVSVSLWQVIALSVVNNRQKKLEKKKKLPGLLKMLSNVQTNVQMGWKDLCRRKRVKWQCQPF